MKSLLVALGVLSLTAISFTRCGTEDPQSNQSEKSNPSEIQSQSSPSGSREAGSNSQVTGLSAKASAPTVINLTWNSVPNATAYWVYRDTHVAVIVTSSNYIHREVSPGTTYTYAIAAVVNGALGPKSSSVTVKTPR